MGLRLRKSIKIGRGTKINISKSGIGYSVGTKGARFTKKAGGGTRTTLSAPGTGLSYVSESSGKKKSQSKEQKPARIEPEYIAEKPKKRKTWLWVLGWICFFPIPLTILLLRNTKMKPTVKYGLLVALWVAVLIIGFFGSTESDSSDVSGINESESSDAFSIIESENNSVSQTRSMPITSNTGVTITNISLSTGDLSLTVGEEVTDGQATVAGDFEGKISPDDIIMVSEDTNVATISFREQMSDTTLGYVINAVGPGKTSVYLQSKGREVTSEKIKVTVLEPVVEVEKVNIEGAKDSMILGESVQASAAVVPDNADNIEITWATSDEKVLIVDQDGNMTAVGGGSAEITAANRNGVSDSVTIAVDGSKRQMRVTVTEKMDEDVNIGDEWSKKREIDGDPVGRTKILSVGDTVNCHVLYSEIDANPDIGEASESYTVTEEDLVNGFSIQLDFDVTENGGKYSGRSAHFVVTYRFSPS